jgi:hypothetical protein
MNHLSELFVKPSVFSIVLTRTRMTKTRAMGPPPPKANNQMAPPMRRASQKMKYV